MINRLKKFFADNLEAIKTAWEWLTFSGCFAILAYMHFGDYDRMQAALYWPADSMFIFIALGLIIRRQQKDLEQLRKAYDQLRNEFNAQLYEQKKYEADKRGELYQFIRRSLAAGGRR